MLHSNSKTAKNMNEGVKVEKTKVHDSIMCTMAVLISAFGYKKFDIVAIWLNGASHDELKREIEAITGEKITGFVPDFLGIPIKVSDEPPRDVALVIAEKRKE